MTNYAPTEYPCCIYGIRNFNEEQAALACAYHEAGHGIVGLTVGMPARDVSIRLGACGRCGAVNAGGENKAVNLFSPPGPDVVMMLAAGTQAELLWLTANGHFTEAVGWMTEVGGLNDQTDAQDVAQFHGYQLDYTTPSTAAPLSYPAQQMRAQVTLAALWDRVTAVAEELAVQRSLTAAEVVRLAGLSRS
ncbi:hypothetical protein [Streptomyces sp. G1]|uniref:hypothetical protein n=1 Tax=Streptomyces sp. G1 TaxID=361572 RepID=UPI00202DF8C5|nr:hypothetical protein [Streptomyces sp. G1]MCM1967245.1 hypothetical protein [Streptomyces sp. G1]